MYMYPVQVKVKKQKKYKSLRQSNMRYDTRPRISVH